MNPYIVKEKKKKTTLILSALSFIIIGLSIFLLTYQKGVTVDEGIYGFIIELSDSFYWNDSAHYKTYDEYSSIGVSTITNNIDNTEVSFSTTTMQVKVNKVDKRAYALDRFFESQGSPLAGHGKTFIKYCDQYGAPKDCLTIPAISFAETNYCKYPNSQPIHNCWGFGGAGANRMKFKSYEEAIKFITERLVYSYGEEFLRNPRSSANTYCGGDCSRWAYFVEYAIKKINDFSIKEGYGSFF